MKQAWPVVSLGEVVRHRKHFIRIDNDSIYRRCRVQLRAQGIVERDQVPGLDIKTKEQQVCQSGELLVAEIDAKVGGFGMVPEELDGAIVSSHYFLFKIEESRLDRRFLGFYLRTASFREQVSAQGSTNYAAIRPQDVLGYKIPLPPIYEQRRTVARIEAIAHKLEEARHLRDVVGAHRARILDAASASLIDGHAWPEHKLGDLLAEATLNGISAKPVAVPDGLSILRISAATSRADATVDESDIKYLPFDPHLKAKYELRPGDLLACRFNGNLHFVGRFALFQGSEGPRVFPDKLIRFRFKNEKVCPSFMRYAANTRRRRSIIEALCATTAGNIGISGANLKTVFVAVPPLPDQRRIVACLDDLQAKVDALKTLQAKTAAELDALMPSILNRAFRGEL